MASVDYNVESDPGVGTRTPYNVPLPCSGGQGGGVSGSRPGPGSGLQHCKSVVLVHVD